MKANPSVQKRGVALVIVLVFVVLLSVFILSFFTNSQNELTAAQSFSGEISAQQLAETATSVVMGQIREATTREYVAWASQPGMLRTYGDTTKTGKEVISDKADAFFKLYSSDDMIIGRSEMSAFQKIYSTTGEIPFEGVGGTKPNEGWDSLPALYTDLNSPIIVAEPPAKGATEDDKYRVKFPIIDGHDLQTITLPDIPAVPRTEKGKTVLTYDATSERGASVPDKKPDIEGFGVDPAYAPKYKGGRLSSDNNPVPMPVKWLYVLRDGSMTAPTGSEPDPATKLGTRAKWDESAIVRPTKENPIVGRMAFWTDDDTCKVNINTAGGFNTKDMDAGQYSESTYAGSYWDQPRTYTRFDFGEGNDDGKNGEDGSIVMGGLSITQPVAKEYQRYPGHPATTSLNLVFKNLLNSEQMYSLLPRLTKGGSKNGTTRFYSDKSQIELAEGEDEDEVTTPLSPKRERLFASVDEFLFKRRDTEQSEYRETNDGYLKRKEKFTMSEGITPELIERLRFFLTAHSRAPELNLFGRPRVTIWPSYPDAARLNASDRLLNFCSIIGPKTQADGTAVAPADIKLFEFQRSDPYSATFDFDGTNKSNPKYGDYPKKNGKTRNQVMYEYLQEMTKESVPGFGGGSFLAKYKSVDRDQILTSIFDYMRCVNMRDSTRDKQIADERGFGTTPKTPKKAVDYQEIEKYKFAPLGIVVPIKINSPSDTKGFGRFPIFSEAALVLYHTGYRNKNLSANTPFLSLSALNNRLNSDSRFKGKAPPNPNDPNDKDWDGKEGVTHNFISAFLIFESFNPMMGYAPTRTPSNFSADRVRTIVEVTGLDKFAITGIASPGSGLSTVLDPGVGRGFGGLRFPKTATNIFAHSSGGSYHGRNLGGSEGWLSMLRGSWFWTNSPVAGTPPAKLAPNKWGTTPPDQTGKTSPHWYEFQAQPYGICVEAPPTPELAPSVDAGKQQEYYDYLKSPDSWQKLQLTGADLDVVVKFGFEGKEIEVRKLRISFPSAEVPVPTDHTWDDPGGFALDRTPDGKNPNEDPKALLASDRKDGNGALLVNEEGVKTFGGRLLSPPRGQSINTNAVLDNSNIQNRTAGGVFSATSDQQADNKPPGFNHTNRWRQLLQPGDVIKSIVFGANGDDPRIAAINDEASKDNYAPHPDYDKSDKRHAQILRTAAGPPAIATNTTKYFTNTTFGKIGSNLTGNYAANNGADLPSNINGVKIGFGAPVKGSTGKPGDFDTGLGNLPDGAYTGKSDEGNPVFRIRVNYRDADDKPQWYWRYPHPYFDWAYEETFDTFFTPNRQTPSAVVFGSLPIGRNGHWTTLCFSPVSAAETSDPSGRYLHPGREKGFARDHLLLDLFNMPIVEPYAISEPFSTAGKVNLNFAMMPFGHIERSTALRAVFHSVRVSAFPKEDVGIYKSANPAAQGGGGRDTNYRSPVDRDMTIRAFKDIFDQFKTDQNLGIFKSASEICDRALYPKQVQGNVIRGAAGIKYTAPSFNKDPDFYLKTTFWGSNSLTGDNMREKPYSDLYPRVTTKSNTYTVHVRAQALRQTVQSAAAGVWDEKKDRLIGEYRGSSTVERYIDPEDARFDPRSTGIADVDRIDVDTEPVEKAYRFRVINTKRFVP